MKIFLILLLFVSCARTKVKDPELALRFSTNRILTNDTQSHEKFFIALKNQIRALSKRDKNSIMKFGPKGIQTNVYLNSLKEILNYENDNWIKYIEDNFDFLEVYGLNDYSEVLVTGYYEPIVKGSLVKTEQFGTPLYKTPIDYKKGTKYLDRKSIDQDQKLANKNLELLWVDALDAFFIQIQGSGLIDVGNNERIRVGYENQNGHPYEAIGKFLIDKIPKDRLGMYEIKSYLKSISKDEMQNILNLNPSYVFFRILNSEPQTSFGTDVTPGRTIAIDRSLFPKGALCFLDVFEPTYENIDDREVSKYLNGPRFVFDQDTGGAIKGTGRVDLYFGTGDFYAQKAGGYKMKGQLYYLFPKNVN